MHTHDIGAWKHSHTFGQDKVRPGERRTLWVIGITAVTMVVEIACGILFGSMALLADGLHMASHALALTVSAFAYIYARRHARDPRFSFGTGKVNALGGFTGAVLLALFAVVMAFESTKRFFDPREIAFNSAIIVAVVGLIVNGACAVILMGKGSGHDHHHGHDHGHDHHHHDHNLRSAYLHVLADALTSVLAIGALLMGKFFAQNWMDPAMGIVGAVLVANWSIGLLRMTSRDLLDHEAPAETRDAITKSLEDHGDNRVVDLHVWSIGPGLHAAIISLVTHEPKPAKHYHALLPDDLGLAHVSIEVHRCEEED